MGFHGIDLENELGMDIFRRALSSEDLEELHKLWIEANALVGQRAPAERAAFFAYGYCEGKQDGLRIGKGPTDGC